MQILHCCSHPNIYTEAVSVLNEGVCVSDETFKTTKEPIELKRKQQTISSNPFNMFINVVIRSLFNKLNIVIGLIHLFNDEINKRIE